MSKIKVGQIYTYKNELYIITKITPETSYKEGTACCLYKDGYVEELWDVNAAANPLIAEYPTWQEAVNSKEFNDIVSDTVNDIVNSKEFNNER